VNARICKFAIYPIENLIKQYENTYFR